MEARQMGFYLNPGYHLLLDDEHAEVIQHLQDFTHYGAEYRGAQRERRDDDPHVACEPPTQDFMTAEQVQWILGEVANVDEVEDAFGTEKYTRVVQLAGMIYEQNLQEHGMNTHV